VRVLFCVVQLVPRGILELSARHEVDRHRGTGYDLRPKAVDAISTPLLGRWTTTPRIGSSGPWRHTPLFAQHCRRLTPNCVGVAPHARLFLGFLIYTPIPVYAHTNYGGKTRHEFDDS